MSFAQLFLSVRFVIFNSDRPKVPGWNLFGNLGRATTGRTRKRDEFCSQISGSVVVDISRCRVIPDQYSFARNVAGLNAIRARGQKAWVLSPRENTPVKFCRGHVARVDVVSQPCPNGLEVRNDLISGPLVLREKSLLKKQLFQKDVS